MRIKILLVLCLVISLAACVPTTHNIPCGDAAALINAIVSANNNPGYTHTINLDPSCSYKIDTLDNNTFGNNGLPVIDSPIVINGNDSTIYRNPDIGVHFRIFFVTTAGELTLNEVTLAHGYSVDPSDPNNADSNSGGAILNIGSVTVNFSTISNNSASKYGGGIYNQGDLIIDNSTFIENHSASHGAGIYNLGDLKVDDSTLTKNTTDTYSSTIYNIWGGTAEINRSTISLTSPWGRGIFNGEDMSIVNSTISHNEGSGIDNEGNLTLLHVTIAHNQSGITAFSGNVDLESSVIALNSGADCSSLMALTQIGANIDTDGRCGVTTVSPNQLLLGPLTNNGGTTETHALLPGSPAIDAALGNCPGTDQRGISRPQGAFCDLGAFESETDPNQGAMINVPKLGATLIPIYVPDVGIVFREILCWVGPGDRYDVVSSLQPGTLVELLGTGEGGGYLVVQNPRYNLPCWAKEDAIDTGEFDLSGLPVFKIPPLPTKTPTVSPLGCLVAEGRASAPKCVVPCPNAKRYPQTCTP